MPAPPRVQTRGLSARARGAHPPSAGCTSL